MVGGKVKRIRRVWRENLREKNHFNSCFEGNPKGLQVFVGEHGCRRAKLKGMSVVVIS